jgi:hypothetical protein
MVPLQPDLSQVFAEEILQLPFHASLHAKEPDTSLLSSIKRPKAPSANSSKRARQRQIVLFQTKAHLLAV